MNKLFLCTFFIASSSLVASNSIGGGSSGGGTGRTQISMFKDDARTYLKAILGEAVVNKDTSIESYINDGFYGAACYLREKGFDIYAPNVPLEILPVIVARRNGDFESVYQIGKYFGPRLIPSKL